MTDFSKKLARCEVFIDGASRGNPGHSGIGIVIVDSASNRSKQLFRYVGETTNNVAEYLAFIYALQEAIFDGYADITVKTDSELLVRQISGQYRVKDHQLRLFYGIALNLIRCFKHFNLKHIPRTQNAIADRLAGRSVRSRTSGAETERIEHTELNKQEKRSVCLASHTKPVSVSLEHKDLFDN